MEEKQLLRDQIFSSLRRDIIEGKYEKGDILVESEIAKNFGVSRTPIREVLRQLELEGLVESVPNKGVFVQGISQDEIKDIYEIRTVLEGLAGKRAAENITQEQLELLRETCDLMEFYTEKDNMEKVAKYNTRFHEIIFEASNSRFLKNMLNLLQDYVTKMRRHSLKQPGRAQKALDEHKAILNALENKDSEMASKLLTEHVKNSSKILFK
ncbi:MAG: GntR family transcriptional regulator [Clostridiales bacterium]|nr:GntR family transcriptional regulator [Clostridiales bacterium]